MMKSLILLPLLFVLSNCKHQDSSESNVDSITAPSAENTLNMDVFYKGNQEKTLCIVTCKRDDLSSCNRLRSISEDRFNEIKNDLIDREQTHLSWGRVTPLYSELFSPIWAKIIDEDNTYFTGTSDKDLNHVLGIISYHSISTEVDGSLCTLPDSKFLEDLQAIEPIEVREETSPERYDFIISFKNESRRDGESLLVKYSLKQSVTSSISCNNDHAVLLRPQQKVTPHENQTYYGICIQVFEKKSIFERALEGFPSEYSEKSFKLSFEKTYDFTANNEVGLDFMHRDRRTYEFRIDLRSGVNHVAGERLGPYYGN